MAHPGQASSWRTRTSPIILRTQPSPYGFGTSRGVLGPKTEAIARSTWSSPRFDRRCLPRCRSLAHSSRASGVTMASRGRAGEPAAWSTPRLHQRRRLRLLDHPEHPTVRAAGALVEKLPHRASGPIFAGLPPARARRPRDRERPHRAALAPLHGPRRSARLHPAGAEPRRRRHPSASPPRSRSSEETLRPGLHEDLDEPDLLVERPAHRGGQELRLERATSARWMSILLAVQPRLRQVPPVGPCSTTGTRQPCSTAQSATSTRCPCRRL